MTNTWILFFRSLVSLPSVYVLIALVNCAWLSVVLYFTSQSFVCASFDMMLERRNVVDRVNAIRSSTRVCRPAASSGADMMAGC